MRPLIFCVVILIVAMVAAEDITEEEDLELIQDEKWFSEVHSCLMDQGPCTDKMKRYKETVPQYIATNCASCSPKEKYVYENLQKMVAEKYPNQFKELVEKMSPKGQ